MGCIPLESQGTFALSIIKLTFTWLNNDYSHVNLIQPCKRTKDQYRFISELIQRMHPWKLIQNVTLYRVAPTRELATSERHSGNHDDYTSKNHNIISVYLSFTEHEREQQRLAILVPIKITLNHTILSLWGLHFHQFTLSCGHAMWQELRRLRLTD